MKKRVLSIILCFAMLIASCGTTWTISSARSKPVRLNASKKSLKVGKKYQLKVKKAKGITIKKKTFTKKGAAVSVSKKGKVTAKKPGKATVSCKVKYKKKGNKKIYRKTLKCKITVLAEGTTETPAPGKASAPAISQETPKPSAEQSAAPTGTMSSEPDASVSPSVSQAPENSAAPENTSSPINTKEPYTTISPDATVTPIVLPNITAIPTTSPDTTVIPVASPNTTEAPTATPAATAKSTATPAATAKSTATPAATAKSTATPAATAKSTATPAATAKSTATPTATALSTATPVAQETKEPAKTPVPPQPSVEVNNSFELIKDMGLGINLGNTLEACGTWIDGSSVSNYELAWQSEKNLITEDMIQGMRKAGFKTLRIPVAWSNMMSTDGTYTINKAYFNRVDQIIGYALDAGMYPIVNIHYDSGWWARFGSKDGIERQEAMKKYKTMWTQLAEHYKDYSNMLIFESANEELGPGLNSTDDYENSGYYTSEDDLYRLTNEINQTFVDIVRASGGKNADRYLLIAGYNTNIANTCDSRFEMPTDTIADHLTVSIHCYEPSTYCIVDDPNNSWGYQESWGSEKDIKELQSTLSKLKIRYTNQGIPVIIGEYGVVSSKPKPGRSLYFQTLCEYALENGMCPVLWEDSGLVYKRSTASMIYEDEAKLYLELSAKAESMNVFVPDAGDGSCTWSGTLTTDGEGDGEGFNFSATSDSLDNTLILSSVGGCYQLSGVDWSKYSAPKLEIKASDFDKTVTIGLATKVNDDNKYWCYIEDKAYEKIETIQPASGAVIDLSSLNLSGTQSLYLLIVQGSSFWPRQNFSGDFTLSISD